MKRPWYSGWQWRDLPLILVCTAILLAFCVGSVYVIVHVLLGLLAHVRHAVNHP